MIFDPVPPMSLDKAAVIATDDAIILYHSFIHPFFRVVQSSEDEESLFSVSHSITVGGGKGGGKSKMIS